MPPLPSWSWVAFLLIFASTLLAVPTQAALGIDGGDLDLGKVEPGFQGTYTWNVTNAGTSAITVDTAVECGCDVYVDATPATFDLDPGATQTVTIIVDVADDADPGIHDHTVRFTERATTGSGGTAQGARAQHVVFYVETAAVFIDAVLADGTLAAKFINGHAETMDVDVTGTLTHGSDTTTLPSRSFTAEGSADRAKTTPFSIALGLDEDSPAGLYTVNLDATWSSASGGPSDQQSDITFSFTHGEVVRLTHFSHDLRQRSIAFLGTLENTGDAEITAWMVVELREPGRPDASLLMSLAKSIAAGTSVDVEIEWSEATGTEYDAEAYAVLGTDGQRGAGLRSGDPLTVSFDAPAGKHRSPSAAAASTADQAEDLPGSGGSAFLSGNVKLVIGLVVGAVFAVTATLVFTKKRG